MEADALAVPGAGNSGRPAGAPLGNEPLGDLGLAGDHAAIWSYDFETETLSWLPGLENLLGGGTLSETEIESRLADLVAPLTSGTRTSPPWREFELEQSFRNPAGEIRWVRLRARTIGDDNGSSGLLGIATDVTDVRENRQALEDLTDRYRLLVELSPDAVCVHEAGVVTYVNRAALTALGASSTAELIGRPIMDFVADESLPALLDRIASLHRQGASTVPADTVMLRLDGTKYLVQSISVRTTWEGRPAFQVIMRDISAQKAAEATLRYQAALISHVSDAIIATSGSGVVTSWNPAAENVYGWTAGEAIGRTVSELVGAALDPETVLRRRGGVMQTTHRHRNGSTLAIRISAAEMNDGFVLVCADETARRRAEQHYSTVVASLDEGVVVIGPGGLIESANPAACRIIGVDHDDLIGVPCVTLELYDEQGRIPPARMPSVVTRRTGATLTGLVLRLRRPAGDDVWISLTSRLLTPEDPSAEAVVASFTDITERRAIGERLAHEATHDPLTELANRTLVLDSLAEALSGAGRAELTTLLFIDLDKFKVINDSLGHSVGDKVLRIAGERLRRGIGENDLVGRLGGDEFVVVTAEITEPDEIKALAEHLREALTEPITVNGRQLHIDASIGIVTAANDDTRTAEDLLRDADVAMYQAKTLGRARYEFFDVELRERMQRRLRMEQDLRDALQNEELWTAYQPVVDIESGEMVAVEALLRWKHPAHGTISPAEFIPLAEESDLINLIGKYVLRTTTREIARRREQLGIDLNLKVNLSARQLDDPHLVAGVQDALKTTGLPPHALTLEVTESALMRDQAAAAEVLTSLRDLGVSLAIDDFGTGYSSLAQLQRLPLDTLKIDRTFVTGIAESRDAAAIVKSIIAMAHAVDLIVVAEGVEDEEQLAVLRELHCDQAQGFHLGRPAPPDELFGAAG
ncbi:sensor domain-containing protein [Amycolatopsis keratiniphila]|uniref:Signal transduction protein containing EAL, PAS and GGDEF domain n=1 Tax=Amycolatopsis keratiniphila TaxID=129921 RepID=R4SS36_9PSEU|nr:EAL domain-containing protein [Amycolatopsis keratiniphila]AGM02996.1 signal transduction protein containing EAL, PAS and GGDEF domain [Amycolatopsis keratiniphila]